MTKETPVATFDIANIVTTDRIIDIRHPSTKAKLGISVPVMSVDDERLTKVKRRITDERLKRESKGKNWSAEELEFNRHYFIFSAMLDWHWNPRPAVMEGDKEIEPAISQPTFNGEIPEFNQRNVFAVFKRFPWFFDQLNEAIGDSESFFVTSQPS